MYFLVCQTGSYLLRFRISLRTVSCGEVLMVEDVHNEAGLVFVLSGALELSQCNSWKGGGAVEGGEFYGSDHTGIERVLYTAYRVRQQTP